MSTSLRLAAAISSTLLLAGCQTTDATTKTQKPTPPTNLSATALSIEPSAHTAQLTLQQAMANPDWMGRQPESAVWSVNGQNIHFKQKQLGTELRDRFLIDRSGKVIPITLAQDHLFNSANAVYNAQKTLASYIIGGDIFIADLTNERIHQVTRTSVREGGLQWLNDGRLVYRVGQTLLSYDVDSRDTVELAQFKNNDAPVLKQAEGFLAVEQQALIGYVDLQYRNKQDRFNRQAARSAKNQASASKPIYLGKNTVIKGVQLAPNGQFALVVTQPKRDWRDDSDIMPNYISDNGNVLAESVRRRVADAKPITSTLHFVNLVSGETKVIPMDSLPGFDEDVLAAVKHENAEAKGEQYVSTKKPRAINLMSDWGWAQSAIKWNEQGTQVAVMLEAWDNKDRWIATISTDNNELISQHRLHDDAWINYTFNDFGWVDNERLYFLSEESGYSQLYTKSLSAKQVAVTQGRYEISNLTLSHDSTQMYFKANMDHPGIYNVYRVSLTDKSITPLTKLKGMVDYQLNVQESSLLLNYSTLLQPEELYRVAIDAEGGGVPVQLTSMVSDEFKAMPLVEPVIVKVPSSDGEQPVYAKVYYPAGNTAARKAVIFNHGAGYLQNSHLGFSGYFREFMFHSMLANEGYVVMDMDYRGSKGYGRDWRTAIYRQMGTPEIQDLQDGVDWLVKHAQVDRQRVGTYGGSYGGFMTFMALLKEPGLFQAGAALRPVTDWAYYNAPYTSNILNTPEVDPIAYRRSSPIYFAEGLQDKLLINAPMVDDNVFFQDVVRIVQRFIELEKEDFETAIYPVEPHGFRQPSSWLDEYRRIYKLFDETL